MTNFISRRAGESTEELDCTCILLQTKDEPTKCANGMSLQVASCIALALVSPAGKRFTAITLLFCPERSTSFSRGCFCAGDLEQVICVFTDAHLMIGRRCLFSIELCFGSRDFGASFNNSSNWTAFLRCKLQLIIAHVFESVGHSKHTVKHVSRYITEP